MYTDEILFANKLTRCIRRRQQRRIIGAFAGCVAMIVAIGIVIAPLIARWPAGVVAVRIYLLVAIAIICASYMFGESVGNRIVYSGLESQEERDLCDAMAQFVGVGRGEYIQLLYQSDAERIRRSLMALREYSADNNIRDAAKQIIDVMSA